MVQGEEGEWICSISEHTELVQGRELNDGLKWPYQNSLKEIQFFFYFRNSKFRKWPKTVKKWSKMTKSENFRPKFLKFFFRIDSECLKTYSKPKKSISKKISRWKFFFGTLPFFDQNGHIVKIFDQNFWKFFVSESIQNVSTHILNRKSWFRKKSRWKFYSGTLPFFRKWAHNENSR